MAVPEPSPRPRFDVASLRCASSLPARLIESSRDAGWTSLLLDHQQVHSARDEFETSPTSDQTIVVMTRGEQRIEARQCGAWRGAVYRPGVAGMTPSGMTDRLRRHVIADAGPACKVNLYLPQALLLEAADHLGRAGHRVSPRPLTALAHADGLLWPIAMALLRALRAGAPNLYAESTAHWLAVHLLAFPTAAREDLEADASGERIRDKRLRRVLEFMEHNFAVPLTVDRLASEAGVSKFHFARLFRHATGITPHRWLSDRRLQAGKQLLLETDLSVAEIARQSGFTRSNYFATQFSKRYGVPPGDFRLGRSP